MSQPYPGENPNTNDDGEERPSPSYPSPYGSPSEEPPAWSGPSSTSYTSPFGPEPTEGGPAGQPSWGSAPGPVPPAGGNQPPPRTYGPPPTPLSPQEERNWSMAAHGISLAAMLFSAGVLGFVGALVIYLMYRDRGPYVRSQAANALNIQIAVAIGTVISYILMFVLIGFLTIAVVFIYGIVLHIIGLSKSSSGEWWTPSQVIRFVQ